LLKKKKKTINFRRKKNEEKIEKIDD